MMSLLIYIPYNNINNDLFSYVMVSVDFYFHKIR